MNSSLCATCQHVNSCSLTTNKTFIWSCSEYENIKESTQDLEAQFIKLKQSVEKTICEAEMI